MTEPEIPQKRPYPMQVEAGKNIMFVCAENLKTSHYVMDLMQDQALDQKFSKQPKQDSLRFADVNTARMKQESVTELTVHCS